MTQSLTEDKRRQKYFVFVFLFPDEGPILFVVHSSRSYSPQPNVMIIHNQSLNNILYVKFNQ